MKDDQNELEESRIKRAEDLLPADERSAYDDFKESGKHGLGPTLSLSLFELYVNGKSVRDIQKQNQVYTLGQVVDAKVRYDWDRERELYLSELHSKARARILQTQMESADFIADVMAATHKKYGGAIKEYLQTGNESALKGFDLGSIMQYNKAIEGLLKITGQDKKKEVSITSGNSDTSLTDITKQALSEDQAARILEVLLPEDGDDDADR